MLLKWFAENPLSTLILNMVDFTNLSNPDNDITNLSFEDPLVYSSCL